MMHPISRQYPARYRVYVDYGRGRVMFEERVSKAEIIEAVRAYPPDVRRFMSDIVREQPSRFLWHYRVSVVERIPLKDVGLA